MEYTCPHCGAPIGANATKCEYCGNSIPNNVSEIVNNSIKIGDYNSIVSSIIGNNNKVVINSDWYNEDNKINRFFANIMWTIAAGVLIYTFYLIGITLWI